jgi:phosphate:Na+ symporter
MVEVIRDVKELRRNISIYTYSDNKYIKKEYNSFRRMIVKVFRAIYLFKLDDNKDDHYAKLINMRNKAKIESKLGNKHINKLIREHRITSNMASSLVNDHDNVNDMIKKLIEVGELLYSEKDSILEPS